jgi:hypothetical protein
LVIKKIQVFHYQKNSNSIWPRAKEKTNLESFMFFFGIGQIVSSRLRSSFEVLRLRLEIPHSATRNA